MRQGSEGFMVKGGELDENVDQRSVMRNFDEEDETSVMRNFDDQITSLEAPQSDQAVVELQTFSLGGMEREDVYAESSQSSQGIVLSICQGSNRRTPVLYQFYLLCFNKQKMLHALQD